MTLSEIIQRWWFWDSLYMSDRYIVAHFGFGGWDSAVSEARTFSMTTRYYYEDDGRQLKKYAQPF